MRKKTKSGHEKMSLQYIPPVNSKVSDQTVHLHSLIRVFTVCIRDTEKQTGVRSLAHSDRSEAVLFHTMLKGHFLMTWLRYRESFSLVKESLLTAEIYVYRCVKYPDKKKKMVNL